MPIKIKKINLGWSFENAFKNVSDIYNSRVDFIDVWLNVLTTLMGILLIYYNPFENIQYYHFLNRHNISSDGLGWFCFFVGIVNLLRVVLKRKTNIYFTSLMKCLRICHFFTSSGFGYR